MSALTERRVVIAEMHATAGVLQHGRKGVGGEKREVVFVGDGEGHDGGGSDVRSACLLLLGVRDRTHRLDVQHEAIVPE